MKKLLAIFFLFMPTLFFSTEAQASGTITPLASVQCPFYNVNDAGYFSSSLSIAAWGVGAWGNGSVVYFGYDPEIIATIGNMGNTCVWKYKDTSNVTKFRFGSNPNASACGPNASVVSGSCTCATNFVPNSAANACVPVASCTAPQVLNVSTNTCDDPTCTAFPTGTALEQISGAGTLPASACVNNCTVTTGNGYALSSGGVSTWYSSGVSTGSYCAADTAYSSPSGASCPAGQLADVNGNCVPYNITCSDGSSIPFDQSCPVPPPTCTAPQVLDALQIACIDPPSAPPTPATCPLGQIAIGTGSGSYCVNSANPCITTNTCTQPIDGTGQGTPGTGSGSGGGSGTGAGSPGSTAGTDPNPGGVGDVASGVTSSSPFDYGNVETVLGSVPAAGAVPSSTPTFQFSSVAFTTVAGCPAPVVFDVSLPQVNFFRQFSISYQPMCDVAAWLRPIFLAVAAVSAAMIFAAGLMI